MVLGQGLDPELGQGPRSGPGQGPESQPQLQHRSAQQTGAWFRLYFPVQLWSQLWIQSCFQSCFRPERTHPWALVLSQRSWRRPLAILLLDRLSSRLWIGFFA